MKKIYALLLAAFSTFISQAQIVEIPDPAFKTKLLTLSTPIDTNGDGEIQVSEAEACTSLSLHQCSLNNIIGIQAFTNLEHLSFGSYCDIDSPVDLSGMTSIKYLNFSKCSMPSINLSGLTGLETISQGYVNISVLNLGTAVNLKEIYFYNSGVTAIDLSTFPGLTVFSADHVNISTINTTGLGNLVNFKLSKSDNGALTGLDVSGMTSLKTFYLSGADISSIDLSNSTLIEELSIFGTNISTLNVSMMPNLKNLYCHNNALTSLNLSANLSLERLSAAENQLSSIDLTNLTKLQFAILNDNQFTTLDFSGQTDVTLEMPEFDFKNNPNLVSVNLKNGRYEYCDVYDFNCPNLLYICVDDADMQDFQTYLQQNGLTGIQVNTYCSFVPGGNFNTIAGVLTFDGDSNGCDAADLTFPDVKMNIQAADGNGTTFTGDNGNYSFYTQTGEFVITPTFPNSYFTVSPSSVTVNFADNNNNTQTESFCITPNGTHHDVEVTLLPISQPRPGFDASYLINFKNNGNQTESGNITFGFDDAVLDLVSASPAISSQSANTLQWDYSNLLPFEKRSIVITLNVNSPMETPPVNNGDVLTFTSSVGAAPDEETPQNNLATLAQTVVGSFDPNDKTCLEGSTIRPEMVGDYLHYVIRFQNSGSYLAENVIVKDAIDTEKFDLWTFELTSASHPHDTRISGNNVEFIFSGINLPAEADDEPASHGFVAFKIKTKPTLALSDVVENTADIFFDYNFPITTNTTSTTVSALGVGEFENLSVSVAPNPVKNILNISAADNITGIEVFDIHGRLLQSSIENRTDASIDFSGKATGVYVVKIRTEKGVKVQKIIKE